MKMYIFPIEHGDTSASYVSVLEGTRSGQPNLQHTRNSRCIAQHARNSIPAGTKSWDRLVAEM